MKLVYTLLLGCLFFVTASPSSAQSQGIYMELTTLGAPSSPLAEVAITSAAYSLTNTVNIFSTPSTSTGKAVFFPMVVTKQADGTSAALQKALAAGGGSAFKTVKINFYQSAPDGSRRLSYQIILGGGYVSSYAASGVEVCDNGCPGIAETIIFVYEKIGTINYVQSQTGSTGTPTKWGWDVKNNRDIDPATF